MLKDNSRLLNLQSSKKICYYSVRRPNRRRVDFVNFSLIEFLEFGLNISGSYIKDSEIPQSSVSYSNQSHSEYSALYNGPFQKLPVNVHEDILNRAFKFLERFE